MNRSNEVLSSSVPATSQQASGTLQNMSSSETDNSNFVNRSIKTTKLSGKQLSTIRAYTARRRHQQERISKQLQLTEDIRSKQVSKPSEDHMAPFQKLRDDEKALDTQSKISKVYGQQPSEEKENRPPLGTLQRAMQLRWRIGSSPRRPPPSHPQTSLPPQIGNGASDPFSASPYPVNHFHQFLLPLLRYSYVFTQLRYTVPQQECPGSQWIADMVSRNIHGAYLFSYSYSKRIPDAAQPHPSHLEAHRGQALMTLRRGLQDSHFTQSLAELNIIFSAHTFYEGRIDEWRTHSVICRDIVQKIGGFSQTSPIFRAVLLVSIPPVCGSALYPPVFPSQDFEIPSWTEFSQLPAPATDIAPSITNPELRSLFHEHQQFQQIYKQHFLSHVARDRLTDPTQEWLDTRFHVLSIISLETYFKLYKINPIDISEAQRIDTLVHGILVLAVSFCHQFIYHSTRNKYGLFGEHPAGSPMNTIPFMHLRNHLKRLFEFEGYEELENYAPILWAVFVLACLEQVEAVRMSRVSATAKQTCWATFVFADIVRKLPEAEQEYDKIQSHFAQFLYADLFDNYLTGLCQFAKKP